MMCVQCEAEREGKSVVAVVRLLIGRSALMGPR
jgi:hypothetical protein